MFKNICRFWTGFKTWLNPTLHFLKHVLKPRSKGSKHALKQAEVPPLILSLTVRLSPQNLPAPPSRKPPQTEQPASCPQTGTPRHPQIPPACGETGGRYCFAWWKTIAYKLHVPSPIHPICEADGYTGELIFTCQPQAVTGTSVQWHTIVP